MAQFAPIPNPFEKIKRIAFPAHLEGQDTFFYGNWPNPVTQAGAGDWILSLFDLQGNEIISDITYSIDGIIGGSGFRPYWDFNIPIGTATGQIVQFAFYDPSEADRVYLEGRKFRLISLEQAERYTFVQWRNSFEIFNYPYGSLSEYDTKYNSMWLPLALVARNPEDELEFYRKASDGKTNLLKGIAREVLKLEAHYFDDALHAFMKILPHHDDVLLNGLPVISKQGYQVTENKFNNRKIGTWEVYNEDYSTINVN